MPCGRINPSTGFTLGVKWFENRRFSSSRKSEISVRPRGTRPVQPVELQRLDGRVRETKVPLGTVLVLQPVGNGVYVITDRGEAYLDGEFDTRVDQPDEIDGYYGTDVASTAEPSIDNESEDAPYVCVSGGTPNG